MYDEQRKALSKYLPRGKIWGNEFLLPPKDALELIDDISHLGILIIGVDTWHFVDKDMESVVQDWDRGFEVPDNVFESHDAATSWNLARTFIQNGLHPETELVSLVLDIPPEVDFFA